MSDHTHQSPVGPVQTHESLIGLESVIEITQLSRSQIYALKSRGDFPAELSYPSQTSSEMRGKKLLWRRSDVDQWIRSLKQVQQSDTKNG